MGDRKERWEQEQRRRQYQKARKHGKPRHSAQNFIRATDEQWAAIKKQIKEANYKAKKERMSDNG